MKVETVINPTNGDMDIHIVIPQSEFIKANFDEMDNALLTECNMSESMADKILALELIVRKIEKHLQGQGKEKTCGAEAVC